LRAFIDSTLKWAPPTIAFPTDENKEEKFWVHPSDPCYATTLVPAPILPKIYFLGDTAMKFSVGRTTDAISSNVDSLYVVDGTGYDHCGPRSFELYTLAMSTPTFASVPTDADPTSITI